MKIATTMKTLALLGLTALTLGTASSQADTGYGYYGANQNFNPWLSGPAYQQARYVASMKERQQQLDQRMDAQLQRILNGMEAGNLTLREATGLLREHLAISAMERAYMADGRLGPRELVDLERRLEEANRHIVFEKHDREKAAQMGRPIDTGRPVDMGRPGYGDRR